MKRITKNHILYAITCCVIASSLAIAGYYYWQYQQVKKNPNIVSQEELKIVTQAISRFMDLPSETPSLATVTDQAKLKDQDFFKNAVNGDKVLIYTKARKVILYRPGTNRIIEFAPLAIGGNQINQQSQILNPIPVTIYNGTTTNGLTNEIENKLKVVSEIKVITKDNAQRKDYKKTLVIDITGANKNLANKIANLLGGEVGSMPDSEIKPDSGILVIAIK